MALRHPLFVSGASGGVTSPQDARLAVGSLLSGVGILNGGAVTGSTSGPNMIYNVAAGSFVTARGVAATDGLYVVPNDGQVSVNSGAPAPGSGTRWDLIWVRCPNAYDGGFGDPNSDPVFGVTVGTAGATPSKPYSSVPAGALVLAESNVGTSIASASLATINMVAVAAGLLLPHAAGSAFYPPTPQVGTIVDDATLGGPVRWNGTAWVPLSGGPLFVGTQATVQSIANGAWGWVTIDTTAIDTHGGHSNTTNNMRYTAQVAGWYRITGRVGYGSSATGVRAVGIAVNAVTPNTGTINQIAAASAGYFPFIQTTTIQYLNVGDYCQILTEQTSGGSLSTAAGSEFTVEWLHS